MESASRQILEANPRKAGEMALLQAKLPLLAGDIFAMFLAFFLSGAGIWWLKDDTREVFVSAWDQLGEIRLALFFGLMVVVVFSFWGLGHYSRRKPFWDELLETSKVLLVVAALDAALVFLGKWHFSRLWFVSTWLLALILVPAIRIQVKRALMRSGRWLRPTVILGVGENAREAAAALRSEPLMGFDVIAFMVPPGEPLPEESCLDLAERRVPVIPPGDDPGARLEEMGRPHLVVALDSDAPLEQQKLLQRLSLRYADMNVIPPIRGLPLFGMEVTHFFSHEVLMLRVRNNLGRLGPQLLKHGFDILGASFLLAALSPLFAYLVWRIRQTGGAAIYGHRRVGKHGKPFQCYKFRTMVPNAEAILKDLLASDPVARAEWARDFKLKNDPRVTAIGAFLRKTSLDELPQLWNVLKGEMSLVGPRPVVQAELERYGDQLDYYLETRPGITGLWQISGRNDIDYCDRVNLDAWYVKNWSLWYDFVILAKTVRVVLRGKGAY